MTKITWCSIKSCWKCHDFGNNFFLRAETFVSLAFQLHQKQNLIHVRSQQHSRTLREVYRYERTDRYNVCTTHGHIRGISFPLQRLLWTTEMVYSSGVILTYISSSQNPLSYITRCPFVILYTISRVRRITCCLTDSRCTAVNTARTGALRLTLRTTEEIQKTAVLVKFDRFDFVSHIIMKPKWSRVRVESKLASLRE